MDIIKNIPNRLECAYCIRNYKHGGECQNPRYDDKGCLAFKTDPKGCIRSGDFKIPFPLYHDVPPLDTWCNDWQFNGVDTEIRITRIKSLKWDTKKGYLIVHCKCDYYENEYHEDYNKPKEMKPKLKVIK